MFCNCDGLSQERCRARRGTSPLFVTRGFIIGTGVRPVAAPVQIPAQWRRRRRGRAV
ncbi:hypothetical protein SBBP1_60041 [Burkholderiales bacterium]|nr:hypothetical protein SBBP1_60041 [Burkholderiales bacterium]